MSYSQNGYTASPSQFGGFGSGGFVNSPAGGGGGRSMLSPGGSQMKAGGGGGAPGERIVPLIPATIKQILDAPAPQQDTAFTIDGVELGHGRILGQIVSVDQQTTYNLFVIDDGTGVIEVKMWTSPDDQQAMEKLSGLVKGTYVKIFGKVVFFQNKRSITSHSITPLVNFNELSHHFLEAIYVHKLRLGGQPQGMGVGQSQVGGQSQAGGLQGGAPMMGVKQQFAQQNQGNFASQAPADQQQFDDNSPLTPVQREVLQIFAQDDSDQGANIGLVFQTLGQFPQNEIRRAVDFLSTEGHVYATIDEEHFKCTT